MSTNKVICHAPGERCLGCDHYHGKAPECKYACAELDSGDIGVDGKIYIVTYAHAHKTLKIGDRVVMGSIEKYNALVRTTDYTLHAVQDEYGQYVHLRKEESK